MSCGKLRSIDATEKQRGGGGTAHVEYTMTITQLDESQGHTVCRLLVVFRKTFQHFDFDIINITLNYYLSGSGTIIRHNTQSSVSDRERKMTGFGGEAREDGILRTNVLHSIAFCCVLEMYLDRHELRRPHTNSLGWQDSALLWNAMDLETPVCGERRLHHLHRRHIRITVSLIYRSAAF
jgi:hypothetical protein